MLLIALCKIVRSLLLKSLFTGNFILCISIHFLLRGYLLGIGSAISKYILEISDGDLLWWQIWSYSSQLVKSCWSYRKFIKNDSGRSSTLTANIIQINAWWLKSSKFRQTENENALKNSNLYHDWLKNDEYIKIESKIICKFS